MAELTLAPLSSRLRQHLPGARSLEAYAAETAVVCAAEEQAMRPAVFADDDIERITGVHEFSAGLNDEIHLATRDHVRHTAATAVRLRNVCLTTGQLCTGRSLKRLTYKRIPFSPARVERCDETVAFCSTAAGNDYFAHFLLDDATTALLGKNFGRPVFGGSLGPRTPHMLDYLRYFDVPYEEQRATRFSDLWLFTDHAQNSHRRARLEQLRERLSRRFATSASAPPAYLRRGSSGSHRALQNEAEIESLLSNRGFRIVDPERMTTDEICRQLNQAPLVVGVEGSQLAHALLNLRPRGALLCIQPAARFNAVYRGFCNSLDLDWGFTVAEGTAARFNVSGERLSKVADKMLEVAA